jgi:Mg2+ and Co2+ transporter CorA
MVGDEPSNERDAAGEDAGQSADPEKGQRSKKRETRGKLVRDPKTRSGVAKLLARLTRNNPKKSEGVDGAEEPDVLAERVGSERITLEPLARCMFEGVLPRGPVVDYDFLMSTLKAELLAEHMDNNRSTARSLAQWIQHENNYQHSRATQGDPLDSLFAIAQRDTLNVLRLMDLALKEIGQHILDDTLIQQRLIHWRHLLERFDTELQQLEDSLRRFATFIGQVGRPDANGGARSATDHLLQDCVAQILILGQRTKSSYTSLMANMSIVESKRGIAEAESVTKLTELAFFFIPLTFSASIFSMQVKELSSSRVSLSTFFILAIIITTCSYALRLFIRSASVISVRRHYMKEIRADAGLPPGASIPTTSFLIWVWHRIGLLTTIVTVIVGILAVPLAFLWTRDMNHGYQAILTVLELVLVLVAAHFVARTLLYTDARGLHFRRDIFKPAPRQKGQEQRVPLVRQWRDLFTLPPWLSSRIFLIALVATAVAVGPVVAVWTRPLEKGIKVGVTIVLGFIYIGSLLVLLLKAIF